MDLRSGRRGPGRWVTWPVLLQRTQPRSGLCGCNVGGAWHCVLHFIVLTVVALSSSACQLLSPSPSGPAQCSPPAEWRPPVRALVVRALRRRRGFDVWSRFRSACHAVITSRSCGDVGASRSVRTCVTNHCIASIRSWVVYDACSSLSAFFSVCAV